jgi:hypothetical protein
VAFLPYTEAELARFAELAEVYEACRSALRDITLETQSRPAPGSPADLDQRALVGREPPIAETAEMLITWTVQLYLYAASEHLGGLAALYSRPEVLLSPLVLGRCAVEYAAHVLWVLGRPAEDPEDRLARAFLEEIFGAEQAKMQAGRLFEKTSEEHRRRREYYKAVRSDAEASFEPPYQNDTGRPMLRGQLLRDGQRVPELQRDLDFHDRLAKLVVVPFYNALSYAMTYHGWALARHKQLTDEIDRLLPGVFVDGPSPATF